MHKSQIDLLMGLVLEEGSQSLRTRSYKPSLWICANYYFHYFLQNIF